MRTVIASTWMVAAALWAGAALAQPAAEPTPPPVNKEQIDAALALTKEAAGKYAFTLQNDDRSKPKLLAEPILRWSNPAAGEIHGNVFLWTVDDRPAVVGSLYKWFTPNTHMSHEFHSLSEAPVRGRYEGVEIWTTRSAGLEFKPLADAPRPAESPTQRLLAVRRFAKDFTATKIERDGNQQELRLLPQPIYRYAAPRDKIQDGAMFVFVQGTDPDVFLLLEARGEPNSSRWMFAAARMNSVSFRLRYREREAWSVEIMPWSDVYRHAETYTSFTHRMPSTP